MELQGLFFLLSFREGENSLYLFFQELQFVASHPEVLARNKNVEIVAVVN